MKVIRTGFVDDWKEDKQLAVYEYLSKKIPETIRAELTETKSPTPTPLAESYDFAVKRKATTGLKTGYSEIDNPLFLGGLCQGSLYVIGGSTGVGKTLFVCNLVLKTIINNNVKTLFLTTEMPHWSVTNRLRQMWNSYLADDENFNDLPIEYLDNQSNITIESIRDVLANATEKYGLLVVDNLQWFSRSGDNVAQATGVATQAIKKMAIEFDIPVILVSHLNRLVFGQENPDLNSLKNSSYIEQDADAVIMLARNQDDENDQEWRTDVLRVSVRKNRLTGNLPRFLLTTDSNNVLEPISIQNAKRPNK